MDRILVKMDDSKNQTKPVVCLRLLTPSSSSGPSGPYAAVVSLAKFNTGFFLGSLLEPSVN